MRDGWVIKSLDEVCTKFGAGPFGSNMKVSTFVDTGIPVVSGNHMTELELVEKSFNYITEDHANRMQSSIVQRNDVVITKAGTIGQVSLIPENSRFLKYILSSRQLFVRPDIEKVLPKYLAIYLKYGRGQVQILSNVNRTGVPSLSQAVSFIKKVQIELPSLPEQKRIVDLISSVDSYIEALQQQLESAKRSRNAVLHELLTAGGDDWLRARLSEICTMIKRGQAPSYTEQRSVTVLNQKCVRNGRIQFEFARQTDSNTKPINEWAYLRAEDTLVNSTGVGTLGRVAFVGPQDEPLTVDSHLTIVRPDENKIQPSFLGLSLHFREADIEGLAAGSSGQTELSREALGNLIIAIPPISEQKRIVEIITSMDRVTNQTQQTITESQNLRSGLLSDLLSGEHEIPVTYDKVMGATL